MAFMLLWFLLLRRYAGRLCEKICQQGHGYDASEKPSGKSLKVIPRSYFDCHRKRISI